jgi:hypothetical protein
MSMSGETKTRRLIYHSCGVVGVCAPWPLHCLVQTASSKRFAGFLVHFFFAEIFSYALKKCEEAKRFRKTFASGMGEMQNLPTDVQRKLAQVLYAGSLVPILDKGAARPWCNETGVVQGRLHGSAVTQLGQHGNVQACIRQTEKLTVFAQVCRTFHGELQVYRKERADALVALVVQWAPPQALELMNISCYEPEDWTRLPDVSLLLFEVYLGSRLQLAISLKRQRVKNSPEAEQQLIVSCGVRERSDSPELCIEPHALCSKSAYDFEDTDNEAYDDWYHRVRTEIEDWLMTQYTTLSAPLE